MLSLAILLASSSANAATIHCPFGGGGLWSDPGMWEEGEVPDADDDAWFWNLCTVTHDAGAPGEVGNISNSNALNLTLEQDLHVLGDFAFREGVLTDGGFDLTVDARFSSESSAFGGDYNGGVMVREGGTVSVGSLALGRCGTDMQFRPGDSVAGDYTTATLFGCWPDIVVTQDGVHYADDLGAGLTIGGVADLGFTTDDNKAIIELNWDSGLTFSDGMDWTLRVGGDQAAALTAYYDAGQIVIGTLPDGAVFDPAVNIVYDAVTDMTYVGFGEPGTIHCPFGGGGLWSDPGTWEEGIVPDADNEAWFWNLCTVTLDPAAPGTVGAFAHSNALDLTLEQDLHVLGDAPFREGVLTDGGFDFTVDGRLSSETTPFAGDYNGGVMIREGGTVSVGSLALGRCGTDMQFRPGDSIAGDYTTATLFGCWPDIVVTQDDVFYGDNLGEGLAIGGTADLGFTADDNKAIIELNFDAGIQGALDWALRMDGDQVAALTAYYEAGQLVIGTVPDGRSFDPAENITYDAASDATYVGFAPQGASAVRNPDDTVTLTVSGATPGSRLYFVSSDSLIAPHYCHILIGCTETYSAPGSVKYGIYHPIYADDDGGWERTFETPDGHRHLEVFEYRPATRDFLNLGLIDVGE